MIIASHVRRVRVPSQASDVDQFLDDLFNPVLDQLSDARSLAASIKGSSKSKSIDDCESLDSRDFSKTIKGGGDIRTSKKQTNLNDDTPTNDVEPWLDIAMFAKTLKGGGRGIASQQQVRIELLTYYYFDIFLFCCLCYRTAVPDNPETVRSACRH